MSHRHERTPDLVAQAKAYAAVGVPHHDIARLMGISTHTLLREYAEEMAVGKAQANANVAKCLYGMAIGLSGQPPNLGAICFWMKCQAGWRESAQTHVLQDPDGRPLGTALREQGALTPEEGERAYLQLVSMKPEPDSTLN